MKPQDKIHAILAEVALLFKMYDSPSYAGGIVTDDYIITDQVKRSITEIQEYSNLTLDQALEYKYNLERCEKLMQEFPQALQELVVSTDFELYWSRLTQNGKEYLLYFHEDSYTILRQVKSSEELLPIDFNELMPHIKFSWSSETKEIFGLPEEFDQYPYNALQLLKQKKILKQLGYNVDSISIDCNPTQYTDFVFKPLFIKLFETKNIAEKLIMLEKLKVSIPWYIKAQLNFVESGEANYLAKVN